MDENKKANSNLLEEYNKKFRKLESYKLEINWLKIQNYRGINKFELDNLTPITVFVGRNNTCKSSILEALALIFSGKNSWFDSLSNDLLSIIIEKRGGLETANQMIHLDNMNSTIQIKGEDSHFTLKISKEFDVNKIEQPITILNNWVEYQISNLLNKRYDYLESFDPENKEKIRELQSIKKEFKEKIWETFSIFLNHLDEKTGRRIYALIGGDKLKEFYQMYKRNIDEITKPRSGFIDLDYGNQILRSVPEGKGNLIFLQKPSTEYLKELHGRLADTGALISVIRTLRERLDYFDDLRESRNKYFVYLKGVEKPISLSSMGDGFQAEITLLTAIATLKQGVILIEEPETNLHPGFMNIAANTIIENSKNKKLQFFISTHSLEFIQNLLEINPNLVKIVRLYKIEDSTDIDYEVIDGKGALNEMNSLKIDLRGI